MSGNLEISWNGFFSSFRGLGERQSNSPERSAAASRNACLRPRLMSKPKLVLIDEPCSACSDHGEESSVHRTGQHEGATILLIEQNAVAALDIAHYGFVLESGSVVLEGPGRDLT